MKKMKQKDEDQYVDAVYDLSESFRVEPYPEGSWKLMKRLGRKLTYWYIEPIGQAQNDFNLAAADAIADLQAQAAALREELMQLRTDAAEQIKATARETQQLLREEQRRAVAAVQTEQKAALRAAADTVDRSLSIAAPESRADAGIHALPLMKLPVIGTDALFSSFRAVQNAAGGAETEQALSELGKEYKKLLAESVATLSDPAACKPIALVCNQFGAAEGMEAIRNEIWDLYLLLRKASRYPACIVSIEPTGTEPAERGDVHYIPEDRLPDWMAEYDPALLIFCESTTAILTAGENCMLLRNAVLRLSGQNPAQALGGSKMQELLHLCDLGVQHYCTASQHAADIMEHHGFRRPAVMYPYIDLQKPQLSRRPRVFDPQHITVGFASSPMGPEQSDSRGIPALCEVVRTNPELHFLVLWRDADAVPVPDDLTGAPNCEIRLGRSDMAAFYSEIDCVLIPFADENYNHACALSALEGMLTGIPAVATPAAGISELIAQCGIGITASGCDAPALTAALRKLPDCYADMQAGWRTERLRELVSGRDFVQYAESCIAEAVPEGVVTLYEWDRQLKLENRHLVRGAAALRAYYQRQDVAEEYMDERFSAYPQNCFDLMERQSVSVLLNHYLQGRHDANLLDLASGTGRILQEQLQFGSCTACDASPAMLRSLRERFGSGKVSLEQLDILSDEIPGCYDAVTIFRFIRHYDYAVRQKLWKKLRDLIGENGVLLFDVPNVRFEIPHRIRNGWGKYHIYDVFWSRRSIEKELRDNGLQLAALVPVGQGLYSMPRAYRDEPMTWTAAARRMTLRTEQHL